MESSISSTPVQDEPINPSLVLDDPAVGPRLIDKAATLAQAKGSVADEKKMTNDEVDAATLWLLSAESPEQSFTFLDLMLNVGSDENPRDIPWRVRSLESDELRAAQKAASGNRATRRNGGEPDEMETHCHVLAKATVSPDLAGAMRAQGYPVNAETLSTFVRERFKGKPGLVTQVAVEIMRISGFDDAHVKTVSSGKS
jgi:hypothetical protein